MQPTMENAFDHWSNVATMGMPGIVIISASVEHGMCSGVDTLNMKAESKSEKLDRDDQSNNYDMFPSSESKQLNTMQSARTEELRDCNTFSDTHCTVRESLSDATTSYTDDKAQEKIISA
ncbi:hypothetical protein PVAP13_2NG083146 [Panicum virgatum]|uniref:Uncharacterized protein n=1 Tax=Panicum virgatum TaxID=38727 RepID=A0A8T0V607_PANVG|nr:hypothetical protein PVAP13_2NG083146 [Panicum virgatum]